MGRTVVSSEEVGRPLRQLREVLPLGELQPVLHVPERLLVRYQLHKPAIYFLVISIYIVFLHFPPRS